MLVYDEQLPVLDDSFEGDTVSLLAVRGGRVDRAFRRNYAWAKAKADRGVLKKISVVVEINQTDWVHTVGAITSALSGARLHWAAVFSVHVSDLQYAATSAKVQDALKVLAPEDAPAILADPDANVKAQVRALNNGPTPGAKNNDSTDVKVGDTNEDSRAQA